MERIINSYQGMNKDMAYDTIPPTSYIDATDIRITTTNGESLGAFTNIQGNVESFTLPTAGSPDDPFGAWTSTGIMEVIGYATIRNRIILFVADDTESNGWIFDVQYDTATRVLMPGFPVLKYYNAGLNFKKKWPIEALGRFESDCIQRIYWTDYNNFFRSINIENANLVNLALGQVDIFPDITYTQPILTAITSGGALMTGEYQIAYKLTTFDGKETLVSPPGNLIHVVSDPDLGASYQYNGDMLPAINSGKALNITVDTSNYLTFESISFLSLYYESANAVPVAKFIETIIIGTQTSVTFIYTGTEGTIFPLELFQFTSKNYPFKTPKTIAFKDNSLIIANIKESVLQLSDLLDPNESFDAKTGRYNSVSILPHPLTGGPGDDALMYLNAFNASTSANPNQGYNTDAHWDSTWHSTKQYRYLSDGITLGGEGANISYTFHLEPMTVDTNGTAGLNNVQSGSFLASDYHDLNDGYGIYPNSSFSNNASPAISGLLRGYKRGETYRFGIVFYTNKGEATFVEYIGDIKFPDISERNSVDTGTGSNYWPISQSSIGVSTTAYNMGIQFSIDFSTCPSLANTITSYQIVRLKREDSDKRRFTQGIMKTSWLIPAEDPSNGAHFDLRQDPTLNDNNTLHMMPLVPYSADPASTLRYIGDSLFNTFPYTNNLPSNGIGDIKSDYLAFYSADVSFHSYNNIEMMSENAGNIPSLLMTGVYYDRYEDSPMAGAHDDLSSTGFNIGLSQFTYMTNRKYRSTGPITYNSIENIKKAQNCQLMEMLDDSNYLTKTAPLWSGYYLRNYWAIVQAHSPTNIPDLNDPQPLVGFDTSAAISRGGSSLSIYTNKFVLDPLTSLPLATTAATNFFRIEGNVLLNGGYFTGGIDSLSPSPSKDACFPIIDLVFPKRETYGGFSLSTLEANVFIIASPVIDLADTNPIVFGGDIFLNMHTMQTSMVDLNPDFFELNALHNPKFYAQSNAITELFVMESSINVDLNFGSTFKTATRYSHTDSGTGASATRASLIQENHNATTLYGKSYSMYEYNKINSVDAEYIKFFVPPINLTNCGENDIRAYISNVKINEERIDSWTKYGINNYYDIDDFGPINRIINFKDNVFFIQDRAIGIYAINRAAITTAADGVPTQLGTGLGFGKHQYYTKEHGSIHQWAVKTTDAGIYYFDAIHRKAFLIAVSGVNSENAAITEVKGIHSFLQQLPDAVFYRKEKDGDDPILTKGVHLGKDLINDEIIFTFLGGGLAVPLTNSTTYTIGNFVVVLDANGFPVYYEVIGDFETGKKPKENFNLLLINSKIVKLNDTIVYDELASQFSTHYTVTPKIWIDNGDILMTSHPGIGNKLYTHNIGNWGEFYGVVQECSLQLVINPQADVNKILRTLEFASIVRDNNKVVDRAMTITAFEIHNEYQATGKIKFSPDRIKRRFDKWRVKIPRDQSTVSQKARFRSSFFILTLYFDNKVNKEFIMNRLMTYFDYQVF
jgi:hypothetical protein